MFICNIVYAQDTIIKFDKLIANGKFFQITEDDGFFHNPTITELHPDGSMTRNGRTYKEISRIWVQYKKMKFYTRDEISQNGYKIWCQEMNDNKTNYGDLLEANYNPSNEKLKNGEVILYATNRKIWMKLTDNGCYKGRKVIKMESKKNPQNRIENVGLKEAQKKNTQVCQWCNKKRYHKVVCEYCNKELKIGDTYFILANAYVNWHHKEVVKSYTPIERDDISKCSNGGHFCCYEHAYEYGKSKGYQFEN